jgi:hypothetical protein
VSAKYRGAWCEGTIKRAEKNVTAKLIFDGTKEVAMLKLAEIQVQTELVIGAKVSGSER